MEYSVALSEADHQVRTLLKKMDDDEIGQHVAEATARLRHETDAATRECLLRVGKIAAAEMCRRKGWPWNEATVQAQLLGTV
jgi:hypothetical protein